MPRVSAVVPRPKTGASPTRPGRQQRAGRTLFWLTAAATFVVTLARNTWVFSEHVYEHGDAALNTMMVQNSFHQLLLVGPVSRVGFPHPGPAYMYVLTVGQALFHDWLPLTASAYGGQFIADLILQSVLLGFMVRTVYRFARSVPAGLVGFGLVFWFATSRDMLGETWLPNLYMTAFALLVVSSVAITAGRTRELPLLALSGALLIHGHVAFLFFVGITWLVSVVAWFWLHRAGLREEIRASRRSLWASLVVLVIFAVPMVLEVVLHYPGPWPDYLAYHGAGSGHGFGSGLRFLGHFWTASYPASVAVLALAAAGAGLLLDQDPPRLRLFVRAYLMLILQTLLFLFYILRGIDELVPVNHYTGFFYETVPMCLLVFPAVHLWLVVGDFLSDRLVIRRSLGWAALAGVLVLVVVGALAPSLRLPNRSYPSAGALTNALQSSKERAGRPVVLRFLPNEWSVSAAVLVQARRQGLTACAADPYWRGLFTPTEMCPTSAGHWAIAVVARSDYHGGQRVIWSDDSYVAFEGTVPNMALAAK